MRPSLSAISTLAWGAVCVAGLVALATIASAQSLFPGMLPGGGLAGGGGGSGPSSASRLLINGSDLLLINGSGDKLLISP